MIAPLKPGITLPRDNGTVIETERLLLRQWQGRDTAPYAAMLSDPGTARFITVDGKPVVDEMTGWRHAVVMAGHWTLHGAGMFVVEEKSSGRFAGRVGPGAAGYDLRSAGASPANFAARVTRLRRRGLPSIGRLRPSISRKSSTVSIARISPRKVWRAGWVRARVARSNCSAILRMSG